ncbi:hypothetical protein M1N47_01385 [Dehalococcoidia bacterium]|nr:hypothetical protein [Dehalococcoidia bacterium]
MHCLKHLRDVDPGLKAMGYRVIYMADHVGTVAKNLQRDFCICNHPDHGCAVSTPVIVTELAKPK